MILKKTTSVLVSPFSIVGQRFNLSKELYQEAINFIDRNAFSKEMTTNKYSKKAVKMPPCCPRCLKAHILKKAGETGQSQENVFDLLASPSEIKNWEEGIGHNGYYLDNEKVISLA